MITAKDLKNGKVMPAWMVHKAAGTLMQARIEFDKELASRGPEAEFEDEEQDLTEFCEDRFVELYGLKKIATENLRDMIKGLKSSSDCHLRLRMFRLFTGIVPNDEDLGEVLGEGETYFYRLFLRFLVDVLADDHLSGLKGAAFWTHFSRPDCVKLPLIYFERVQDRIGALSKATIKHVDTASSRVMRAMLAKRERDLRRMVTCCDATLVDHAKGTLLDTPDIGHGAENKAKVFEYGNVEHVSKARTKKDPSAKKPMNPRVCVDCFLFRAVEHWIRQEELEQEQVLASYRSWDLNGDGKLQLDEFGHMIKFANPTAGQRRVIRAFIAASGPNAEGEEGEECVLVDRLVPALRFYGLELKDRPSNWTDGTVAESASGEKDDEDDRLLAVEGDEKVVVPMDPSGPSIKTRSKTMQMASRAVMKQLGQLTSALRAMGGDNLERVKEEDVVRASEQS